MIISFGFVICAVAYIQIVNVIRKQLNGEKNRSSPYKVTTLTQMSPEVSRRSESTMSDNGKMLTLQKRKNREQCYKDSRMITITLLIATGVSFAGYIIHFSAIIIRTEVKRDVLQEIQSLYSVLVRGIFYIVLYILLCTILLIRGLEQHVILSIESWNSVSVNRSNNLNLIYRELTQCLCKQVK